TKILYLPGSALPPEGGSSFGLASCRDGNLTPLTSIGQVSLTSPVSGFTLKFLTVSPASFSTATLIFSSFLSLLSASVFSSFFFSASFILGDGLKYLNCTKRLAFGAV